MRKDVWTCDICKQEKPVREMAKMEVKLTGAGICINDGNGLPMGEYFSGGLKWDICKECLEKKGFVIQPRPDDPADIGNANRNTLEDKLLDMLRELGVQFEE